jgi:hypothetical protein
MSDNSSVSDLKKKFDPPRGPGKVTELKFEII